MKTTKNNFLYGAVVLIIASLIAKLLGAFYRVPLMSMIGSTGLGIFQLIFPIYSFFLILISGGIANGMSKVISLENQKNGGKNEKKFLSCAIKLMLMFSIFASIIILCLSFPLSSMQGDKKLVVCYLALIPALIFSSIISVFRGYYQGKQNMFPSGISLVIEQGVKLLASLILAKLFIKKSLIFAVFGAFLGISISELIALGYFVVRFFYKKENISSNVGENLSTKECYKKIIKISLPIMLNNIILPLTGAIESSIVVFLLTKAKLSTEASTSLFGLENGIVGSLINLPTVFASAISTSILPSITASFNANDIKECENKCKKALKITWLVCLPCFLVFLFFAKDIVLFLYSGGLKTSSFDELKVVVDLIKLSSLNILYLSLLSVITSILQAINKSFVPVKNLLLGSFIKIILTFVLVPNSQFNVYGLVISDAVCFSLALILNLSYLKKYLDIKFDALNFVIKPVVCSVLTVVIIVCLKAVFGLFMTNRLLTLSVMLFGAVSYVILVFFTKVIDKNELPFLQKFKKKT